MFSLLFVVLAVANALNFRQWTAKHGKKFSTVESLRRRAIFNSNARIVDAHNKQNTYQISLDGPFAAMTNDEYNKLFKIKTPKLVESKTVPMKKSLPKSLDWRSEGKVTSIKNQEQCGSCYAFSTVAALESRILIQGTANFDEDNLDLSEQQVVSCSNQGKCNGGDTSESVSYIHHNGIMLEKDYKYTATNNTCTYSKEKTYFGCSEPRTLTHGSEDDLVNAIVDGPVSSVVDASHISFQLYKSGVYSEPLCKSDLKYLTHGITVVGYGSQGNSDYYIVKNSWGQTWGDHGYILMSRNKNNQCGIATYVVIIDKSEEK
ncbi:Cysteine proteinase 3 [Entamoeba marina]